MKIIILLLVAMILAGCTIKKLTVSGKTVVVAHTLTDVAECERISTIKAKAGNLMNLVSLNTPGSTKGQRQGALVDARNKAAQMNGDRILAVGEFFQNGQEYDVYACN